MGEFIVHKTALIVFAAIVFLLGGIGTAVFLLAPSNSSKVPDDLAQASNNAQVLGDTTCAAPGTVQNVKVAYPACTGDNCDFNQASCSWTASTDAASYTVTVTEVETGTVVVNNQSEPLSTTTISFPITQGKTYKCDVYAVASCGTLSAAASDQLLCQADALLSPTATPSATPIITSPPTTQPPIQSPGNETQTIVIMSVVAVALLGGFALLKL